jgi:hypothetical protein
MKKEESNKFLLHRFENSGLSVSLFCLREGICQSGFRRLLARRVPELKEGAGFFQPISFLNTDQGLIPVADLKP